MDVYLSAEDKLEESDEQDTSDAHGEGEHGGEQEAPPLPVTQALLFIRYLRVKTYKKDDKEST